VKGTYSLTCMSVPAPVWRNQIFWFVMVLVFVYAGVYNCLPVTFPIFKRVFGTSLEQMGRSQSVFFVIGIVFSLCGGWMIGRMGLIHGLIAALLAISASLTLIGGAPEFSPVLLVAFCFGLAMTALSFIYSSMFSRHFDQKRQSVFFRAGLAAGSGTVTGTAALGAWFTYAEESVGTGGRDNTWRRESSPRKHCGLGRCVPMRHSRLDDECGRVFGDEGGA
jgi:MFS family permease